jgi:predicted ester cyclase
MVTETEPSVVAANCALARRFFAEQDRLKGGPAEDLCAEDYQAYLGGAPPVDRAGHEAFAKAFYAGFEGIHHDLEDVFAAGDRAAVRFVLTGTHTGSFFGIPPSRRPVVVAANIILHIADGKVTKLFGMFDEAGMLRQIGAVSP